MSILKGKYLIMPISDQFSFLVALLAAKVLLVQITTVLYKLALMHFGENIGFVAATYYLTGILYIMCGSILKTI